MTQQSSPAAAPASMAARIAHLADWSWPDIKKEWQRLFGGEPPIANRRFVEKRIASNIVVRLTGSNLLDSSKDEVFDKFNTIADQIDRDYDEYELETEEAGPSYQLVMRWAF